MVGTAHLAQKNTLYGDLIIASALTIAVTATTTGSAVSTTAEATTTASTASRTIFARAGKVYGQGTAAIILTMEHSDRSLCFGF